MSEKKKEISKFALLKRKISRKFSLHKKEEKPTIPKRWRKGKQKTGVTTNTTHSSTETYKIRIPFLRTMKRYLAGLLLLLNGLFGIASLTMPTIIRYFGFLFLLNAFILLDYLWKTARRRIKIEEE